MKYTQKREKIIEIFRNGSLLTANEVYNQLSGVDRATVYRNLDLLTKEGILRKVNVKEGISSYEINHADDNHQHFICTKCDKILPVEVNTEIIHKILPKGIEFEDFELNVKGKCGDCQK